MTTKVEKEGIVLQYNWKLRHMSCVPGNAMPSMTSLSSMINYRGLESFRFGLKNQKSPVLFLMAANLQQLGCQVSQVVLRHGMGRSHQMGFVNCYMGEESSQFQCFSTRLPNYIPHGYSFSFKIYLAVAEGLSENFEFQRVERSPIMSDYRHNSASTDFDLIVGDGKKFPIHKLMLAARSSTFASLIGVGEFKEAKDSTKQTIQEEVIKWATAASMEKFIDFIYTGEVRESARSFESPQELLKLARHYQIKSLENLCESAATVVTVEHLTSLALHLTQAADRYEPPMVKIDR